MNAQQKNGLFAKVDAGYTEVYSHGICTLMLAEAAGMTDAQLAVELKERLERAVKVILKSQRADGRDASLLNVPNGAGIAVADCDRPGWNARELASSWGKGYAPLETTLLRHTDESRLPDVDFAARHDDASRLGWLAERLREALARASGRYVAIVLPPMLGVDRACAALPTLRPHPRPTRFSTGELPSAASPGRGGST